MFHTGGVLNLVPVRVPRYSCTDAAVLNLVYARLNLDLP
eukprot:SAG31_NODE_31957_length_362_cov_0.585551_1_plen_38_part_01